MEKPFIKACNLSKTYCMKSHAITVVSDVNLEIYKGQSLSIMGPSGSGKSTLLHLLGCLDTPTTGKLFFKAKQTELLSDEALSSIRSQEIGFVFQAFNLLSALSVYENICLPFQYQSKPTVDSKKRVDQVIDQVGLQHRTHHRTNQLSGGEMQRAAIARALVMQPSIILADEPTGNLDSKNSEQVLSLMSEVQKTGVAVVVVTHDKEVASHFDHHYLMKDGVLQKA